jgi:hypothetical protein
VQTTQIEQGIVSSRVALLLRSAEIQPQFCDLFGFFPNSRRGVAPGRLSRSPPPLAVFSTACRPSTRHLSAMLRWPRSGSLLQPVLLLLVLPSPARVGCAIIYHTATVEGVIRSYPQEYRRSHQNSQLKPAWAGLVLG